MIVGPRWWEAPLRTLDKDPQVGAVAGKIILPDGRIDHAGLALLEWWDNTPKDGQRSAYGSRLTSRSILAGRPAESSGSNQPMRVQALSGEALMVRASAFFPVGGFSSRLGRDHHQTKADFEGEIAGVDLCLRLGSRGWDCVYRHESVMTRLRVPMTGDLAGNTAFPEGRDQDIFNRTWLGRVRGDFRILPDEGTVPTEQGLIRRYIEPVIRFDSHGITSQSVSGDRVSRTASSVVMVTANDLKETRRCVASILEHTDPLHEIIFVDCGSTDGTREYLDAVTSTSTNCRLITNQGHPGFAAAHNQGLAVARGKHLILLSSHAVVTPRWVEILVGTAELYPRAGLVGPVTNRVTGMQHLPQLDYDQDSLRGLNSFAAQVAELHDGRVDKTMRLAGFCLLIKRELLARIGGLDERFALGNYEDNDYCLRGQLAGYESLVARGCYVHHDDDAAITPEQISNLALLMGQWEIFKTKWGIPRTVSLGDPMDMAALLSGGFQVQRHFQPLPMVGGAVPTACEKPTQAAHA